MKAEQAEGLSPPQKAATLRAQLREIRQTNIKNKSACRKSCASRRGGQRVCAGRDEHFPATSEQKATDRAATAKTDATQACEKATAWSMRERRRTADRDHGNVRHGAETDGRVQGLAAGKKRKKKKTQGKGVARSFRGGGSGSNAPR